MELRRKGLIFDSNGDEYAAKEIVDANGVKVKHKIEAIRPENIVKYGQFKGTDIKRIRPFYNDGTPMTPDDTMALLHRVTKEFRNGHLMIEDFSTLIGDVMDAATAGYLCNVRHRGTDLTIALQGVGAIVPKLRRNTKIIRYHYQSETIAQTESKFKDEAEIFFIVEKLVNKQYFLGNKFFHVYVDRIMRKVSGTFSPRMFVQAIQEYILQNPGLHKFLRSQTDLRGKKLYTYEEAIKITTVELFNKYYGNKPQPIEEREPFITIATGAQGIGKSYETFKQMLYIAFAA